MGAVIWLVLGAVLIVAEVLSGDFVLLMLGVAALAAAGSATLTDSVVIDVLVFGVTAVGLIALARPVLKRRLALTQHTKTNAEALVGDKAVVVSTVDSGTGRVKLQGEIWSARSYDETQVLEPGRSVTVMDISGATAVVWGGP